MAGGNRDKLLLDVGRRIRESRVENGLSQDQLACMTCVNAPALSLIENGKRDPRLTTLGRIANALRVPLADLIDGAPAVAADPGIAPSAEGYDMEKYE